VESEERSPRCGAGRHDFIPAEEKIVCEPSKTPLLYFDSQAPNRFVTTILDGTQDDLAGIAWKASLGSNVKHSVRPREIHAYFIDTNKLPRKKAAVGEVTEVLNRDLCGAKNVVAALRWLKSGEKFKAEASGQAPASLPDGREKGASTSTTKNL